MPIRITFRKETGLMCPLPFCDLCGEEIQNYKDGGAFWSPDVIGDKGETAKVVFLHNTKGCHWKAKHSFSEIHEIRGPFGPFNKNDIECWMPLGDFVVDIPHNVGLNVATDHVTVEENIHGPWKDALEHVEVSADSYPAGEHGWVYFVAECETPRRKVKIGYSEDVYKRIQMMQTGSPVVLKCLGAVPGTQEDEKLAHDILKDFHSRGEWFFLEEAYPFILGWLNDGGIGNDDDDDAFDHAMEKED